MLPIYYAHPISLYNTDIEKSDIQMLASMGFYVVNPNTPEHAANYQRVKRETGDGMRYFLRIVDSCAVCAFRSFPNGDIPAGVAKEARYMHALGRPVFELSSISNLDMRTLSVERTKEMLNFYGTEGY